MGGYMDGVQWKWVMDGKLRADMPHTEWQQSVAELGENRSEDCRISFQKWTPSDVQITLKQIQLLKVFRYVLSQVEAMPFCLLIPIHERLISADSGNKSSGSPCWYISSSLNRFLVYLA
jgi:hypothetical protein